VVVADARGTAAQLRGALLRRLETLS
jgi:hypothetical protein